MEIRCDKNSLMTEVPFSSCIRSDEISSNGLFPMCIFTQY